MTESVQNFRAAFHGFNREDVVRFLEATAARHAAEVNQLRDDVKRLEEELASPPGPADPAGPGGMGGAQAENASLKAQIEELETQLTEPAAPPVCRRKKPIGRGKSWLPTAVPSWWSGRRGTGLHRCTTV